MLKYYIPPIMRAFILISLALLPTIIEPQHSVRQVANVEERKYSELIEHLTVKYKQPEPLIKTIVTVAHEEAERINVDPYLLLAIIEAESKFDPTQENRVGAKGLMQIMAKYHMSRLEERQTSQAFLEPERNIRIGSQILKEFIIKKKGDLPAALQNYSGNTRNYAKVVFSLQAKLKKFKHNHYT